MPTSKLTLKFVTGFEAHYNTTKYAPEHRNCSEWLLTTGDNSILRTEPLNYFCFDLSHTLKGLLPEIGSVAHAAQEAD